LAGGSRLERPHVIIAVFGPTHFSVDSRNENLPNKRIHQNYVWIAVPVRPFLRRASARNDRPRPPLVGDPSPLKRAACLKRTACHARTATPDKVGEPSIARASFCDASGPYGAVR